MPVCEAGTIISFTLDETETWIANDNVDTHIEYVFKTAYDAVNNKALTESDIAAAAVKGVVTNINSNTASADLPTTEAVVSYVNERTAGLSGLTGAMHFKGSVNSLPDATSSDTFNSYDSGDVVLGPNNKEYVYLKGDNAADSAWIELGDEGSYALKSSTDTITEVSSFTANTLPTLTVTSVSIPNITNVGTTASLTTTTHTVPKVTQAGTATTASVTGGILTLNIG